MSEPPDRSPPARRRDFLNLAIAGTATALGAAAGYPALSLLRSVQGPGPKTVSAGAVADFGVGSARTVLLGERPALVIRLADGEFRAFVGICTHLDCLVRYSPEAQRIECPCHDGVFDLDGVNVSGPPPRPLQRLRASVEEGRVVVSEG